MCEFQKHFAADMILATDALARQLVPPGFECCERELLGRSWRRDGGLRDVQVFCRILDPAWKPLWDIMAEPHELPGRPGRRDWGMHKFRRFFAGSGKLFRPRINYEGWMLWVVLVQHSCPSAWMHPVRPGRLMGTDRPPGEPWGLWGFYLPQGGRTPYAPIPHCGIIHYGVPVGVL